MNLRRLARAISSCCAFVLLLYGCGGGGSSSSPEPTDRQPPQTTLSATPATFSNAETFTFSFSSSESNSTFQCRVDGGTAVSCTSPYVVQNLSEGEHTFAVSATDSNGNTDATWASYSWTVDRTPPSLEITGHPRESTSENAAVFVFEVDEIDVSFECNLNSTGFVGCENPHRISSLAEASQALDARVQDQAGNTSSTVSYSWSVDSSRSDRNNISGTVSSTSGSQSGVWVIAETTELPTGFAKIVVTDDRGRFLLPDLPKVEFAVWVRGYGVLDTPKFATRIDHELAIKASDAPTPQDAAQVYPGNYWYSLVEAPPADDFPGTGSNGNGIGTAMKSQGDWLDGMKDRCQLCHQMGNGFIRVLPEGSNYASTREGWDQRVRLGTGDMNNQFNAMGRERMLDVFTNWTDRIVSGAVPDPPPRPSGVERNLVITQWDWTFANVFVHDNISTDKRQPDRNPYGRIYGVSQSHSLLSMTDPTTHSSNWKSVPLRRDNGANVHNPMFDHKNRVWLTSTVRRNENPAWCNGADLPNMPVNVPGWQFSTDYDDRSLRQLSYYDVTLDEFVLIDTCFATHHLQFSEETSKDYANVLWTSGDYNVIGWFDTDAFDPANALDSEQAVQHWCPTILDHNGNGQLDAGFTQPWEPFDPNRDARLWGFAYGIIPNPKDDSVWFTRPYPNRVPGQILRLDPKTCLTEQYQPPYQTDAVPISGWGFSPRGIDIDTNGVLWTALSGSGHIASFDRSKCSVLNGPTATGQHCPEGWNLYPTPGPNIGNVATSGSADFHYYIWVDQDNALGLGENVPIANGTGSDSLIAWLADEQRMVTLRVPYPLGFYQRGLDGRIDDATLGWKGRGVWASNNTVVLNHIEGGEGRSSQIMQFQFRPHPLAD